MIGEKQAFNDFREAPISFMPTYKFDTGTDNWDTRYAFAVLGMMLMQSTFSEKARCPAWCDRILWWLPPGEKRAGEMVKELFYRGVNELRISDHKPVCGCFKVQVLSSGMRAFLQMRTVRGSR